MNKDPHKYTFSTRQVYVAITRNYIEHLFFMKFWCTARKFVACSLLQLVKYPRIVVVKYRDLSHSMDRLISLRTRSIIYRLHICAISHTRISTLIKKFSYTLFVMCIYPGPVRPVRLIGIHLAGKTLKNKTTCLFFSDLPKVGSLSRYLVQD